MKPNRSRYRLLLPVVLLGLCTTFAATAEEPALTATQVKERIRNRLDGYHFTAHIRFDVKMEGFEERRELVVYRDDQDGERERLMAQFEWPSDMRGTGLLYIEGIEKANAYFIYQPSSRRVRRIPVSMVTQDVYGVDLEYMGFGVAQLQPVELESLEKINENGTWLYRLVEKARYEGLQRFDRRILWIDPETFIPVRAEHRRDGKTTMIATTLVMKDIDGIPTPVKTRYERPLEGVVTHMTVKHVDYKGAIPKIFFSTLQLMKVR